MVALRSNVSARLGEAESLHSRLDKSLRAEHRAFISFRVHGGTQIPPWFSTSTSAKDSRCQAANLTALHHDERISSLGHLLLDLNLKIWGEAEVSRREHILAEIQGANQTISKHLLCLRYEIKQAEATVGRDGSLFERKNCTDELWCSDMPAVIHLYD